MEHDARRKDTMYVRLEPVNMCILAEMRGNLCLHLLSECEW
jgi:hypothetical protein